MHRREVTCHPKRAHWALGLCASCYVIQRRNGWPGGKPVSVRKVEADCHLAKKHYARGMCVTCYGAWKAAQPATVLRRLAVPKEYFRDRHFQSKYGITVAERDALVAAQGGACAICKRTDANLHVDHDHGTGAIRGMLCGGCNRGIGLFEDSPERLASAAAYLKCGPGSSA